MLEEKYFIETPESKLFIKIAIPGAIGMFFSAIYQILDGLFVSNFVSNVAFSALNLTLPLVYIAFSIADLVGIGSSVLIAILLGKKDLVKASRLFSMSIILIFVLEGIITILLHFLAPNILDLLNASGELKEEGIIYLRVYAYFLPVSSLVFALDNYLRISGKVKTSMFLNVLMTGLIALFDYILIVVLKQGIWAAAFASSLAFTICAILGIILFVSKKMVLKFSKPSITRREFISIFKNGGPAFINNISGRLMGTIFNVILLQQAGDNGVNAYGVLMSLEVFILPILYGICDSLQPATGYNYGAGKIDRVKKIQKLVFGTSFIICFLSFIIMLVGRDFFSHIYIDDTIPGAIQMTNMAIMVYSFTYVTRSFSFSCQTFFESISWPLISSIISLAICLVVPLILLGCFYALGTLGIWLIFPVASLIVGIMSMSILIVMNKKGILFKEFMI